MFSTQSDNCIPHFVHISDIISLFAAEFEEAKSGISGKGLTCTYMYLRPENIPGYQVKWGGSILVQSEIANARFSTPILFSVFERRQICLTCLI